MNPTHCPNCETELNGATTCPNCGWQAPARHTILHSSLWNTLSFWAMMVGMLGGCGYLAYAGLGAFGGWGPLGNSPWLRWLGIAAVAVYIVVWMGRMNRRGR